MRHIILPLVLQLCYSVDGFLTQRTFTQPHHTVLHAKTGKGFGKQREQPETKPKVNAEYVATPQSAPAQDSFLTSVKDGGSDDISLDPNMPPEERTKLILRQQYGLKPLSEQKADEKQQEALNERRKKQQEWQKKAETQPSFDLMTALPAPVLIGIFLRLHHLLDLLDCTLR